MGSTTEGSKHDDDMGKGVVIDRLDSNDARVIIIPKEANKIRRSGRSIIS